MVWCVIHSNVAIVIAIITTTVTATGGAAASFAQHCLPTVRTFSLVYTAVAVTWEQVVVVAAAAVQEAVFVAAQVLQTSAASANTMTSEAYQRHVTAHTRRHDVPLHVDRH